MSKFTLLFHSNESGASEVAAVDGNDGPDDVSATLLSLVEDWVDDEALDGELHPYLDGTLNVLSDLCEAQRLIVLHLEEDDPHAADMLAAIDALRAIIHPIMRALEEDG